MEGNELDSTLVLSSRPVLTERFDLISVLGHGGTSTVYRVRDRYNGNKEVALKLLVDQQAVDDHTLQRFKNEFSVCKKIRHNNILKAYELINLKDGIAFTMEYVQGQDLATLFGQKRFTMLEIDKILLQLLNAVEELHNHNVLHRDIKLENILIRDDGVLKLGDLGLMKTGAVETMTKSGVIVGTAQYMPPEYVTDSRYDARGDIYGIGMVLHELLCGERRLADKSGKRAIKYLLKTDFKIPKIHLAAVPPKYHKMIKMALDPDPDKRFQTITEIKEVLRETQSREAIPGTVEMVGNIRIDECLKRRFEDEKGAFTPPKKTPRWKMFSWQSVMILGLSLTILFVLIYAGNSP
jgi:serine/threonine-protein kinase